MQKIIQSSANPEKISLTVKSLGLALIPVVLIISKTAFNYDLNEKDLIDFVSAVSSFIAAIGFIFGLCRKVYYKLK